LSVQNKNIIHGACGVDKIKYTNGKHLYYMRLWVMGHLHGNDTLQRKGNWPRRPQLWTCIENTASSIDGAHPASADRCQQAQVSVSHEALLFLLRRVGGGPVR